MRAHISSINIGETDLCMDSLWNMLNLGSAVDVPVLAMVQHLFSLAYCKIRSIHALSCWFLIMEFGCLVYKGGNEYMGGSGCILGCLFCLFVCV